MRQKRVVYDVPEGRVIKSGQNSDMKLTLDVGHRDEFYDTVPQNAENTYTIRLHNTICDYSESDWDGPNKNLWLLIEDGFGDVIQNTIQHGDRYSELLVVVADVEIFTDNLIMPMDIRELIQEIIDEAMGEL